ncbi:phosphoribosylformylglycinamidine synthase [uncultured Clostridium sp.]|uniref:phosphoribosylformylglycinamidine synthase n=1 Tax=uncultured Clostridium sp. TaxID=59620 RepID=UPI00262DE2B3|nr:phosphoribosylformylglycinamidine synthase [uncultured Clostridium sp.]
MALIKTIFVEKKEGFNVESNLLLEDFKENLGIENLEEVRVINKYIIGEIKEEDYKKSLKTIFSELPVDNIYEKNLEIGKDEKAFAVEFLPGQYDQRADSASECLMLLTSGEKIEVKSSKIIILNGNITDDELIKIKKYYINPVDSREVDINNKDLINEYREPKNVEVLNGFRNKNLKELEYFHKELGLAMTVEDLNMIREYFILEEREPSITEIKVIDTYWSDHCRHTTFLTTVKEVQIEEGKYNVPVKKAYEAYIKSRDFVYGENTDRKINLMDMAVICMKELRKRGYAEDLDISDEINACSINVNVETEDGVEEYLLMFKNETHNHPTEIEPFGGAATCLGGAIRDPLSGRTYVYGAMRVTGSGDPTVSVEETLGGKLPQRKITLGAAHGYSSYGNQIGLATGQVDEIYHENYRAKRMEVGAVIAAAPKENVLREEPSLGDKIILLGGKTGRDGIGGATGSSKEHTEDSINECGAEVQKGNPPTERKIQRLFRNKEVTKMIKRCNDFGAGGVSVAIGELCRGLDIDLDKVPKKYEGLDGTEIAISESQERMAVVIEKENVEKFIELSKKENLEAVVVATVTDTDRLRMFWRKDKIVDISRNFLDTNGVTGEIDVKVINPLKYPFIKGNENIKEEWIKILNNLNVCDKKGLIERFDSTIGSRTVLMPLGGKYSKTPAEGMAFKIPVKKGESKDASIMTYGFNPELGMWSPFHMAYYAVIESITKFACLGGDYKTARLTFQEYFERLGDKKEKWGKPFAALLGAYKAQMDLKIPAIGGKDSMSGSFKDLDVPPTLVSFAVGMVKAKDVVSPEFKKSGSKVVLVETEELEDKTINMELFKSNLEALNKSIKDGKVLSACSIKFGGIAEALSKMCIGNNIGIEIKELNNEELFGFKYGSFILEVEEDAELNGLNFREIGRTTDETFISSKEMNLNLSLEEINKEYEKRLEKVFKSKTEKASKTIETKFYEGIGKTSPMIKVVKPKIVIPVFPGTNCEYDCKAAFEKVGGEVKEVILRNYNKEALLDSIEVLKKEIQKSQIIMLPGGFSAGDEPDGSAKFIVNVLRNEEIKDAVTELLNNRDGLMLGICNGFQALMKLGLLPYGEICDIEEDMGTLTYNNINRHMSAMVRTKVVSKKSAWLNEVTLGDIHSVPISHGEGKFVAPEALLKKLSENGQVATQYVDFDGNISMDMPFNPNGSTLGIEGITSPDGRIFGKMAHSERIGENLYKNMDGNFDQGLFKSGVNYFK